MSITRARPSTGAVWPPATRSPASGRRDRFLGPRPLDHREHRPVDQERHLRRGRQPGPTSPHPGRHERLARPDPRPSTGPAGPTSPAADALTPAPTPPSTCTAFHDQNGRTGFSPGPCAQALQDGAHRVVVARVWVLGLKPALTGQHRGESYLHSDLGSSLLPSPSGESPRPQPDQKTPREATGLPLGAVTRNSDTYFCPPAVFPLTRRTRPPSVVLVCGTTALRTTRGAPCGSRQRPRTDSSHASSHA
ncbi:hypothetical protein ACVW19_000173 [Streptomyces sp. TE5632]